MAIKVYTQQYSHTLPKVFGKKQHFLRTFGGSLQVKDGIQQNDAFISLKTIDTDVVVQSYSVDANTGFGTGTGKSSRFGDRKEIKAVDTKVEYEAPLAIHEGVDGVTVNDIPDRVVAERQVLHAEAWSEHLNGLLSKALSDNASETLTGELTKDGVIKVFNTARAKFTNNHVSKTVGKVAYVSPDVYSLLQDNSLTTTAKGSTVDIDNGVIQKFKGFVIEELAEDYFQSDENIIFAADNVGVVGVGIQVYRAIDSEDFAGVALQAAAKYGKYIPEKNKKAILKATLTGAL